MAKNAAGIFIAPKTASKTPKATALYSFFLFLLLQKSKNFFIISNIESLLSANGNTF